MKKERAGEVEFQERQHPTGFVSASTRDRGPPTYRVWDESGYIKTLVVGLGVLMVMLLPYWIADGEYANK